MTITLGEQLHSHQEKVRKAKKPWPMPPKMPQRSYAKHYFSEMKIAPDSVANIEQAFKKLWRNLSAQIRKGDLNPSYQILDGPGATGHQICLAKAMFQNHETWQRFVQKCDDNNLAMDVSDHTDGSSFDVSLHFCTNLQ